MADGMGFPPLPKHNTPSVPQPPQHWTLQTAHYTYTNCTLHVYRLRAPIIPEHFSAHSRSLVYLKDKTNKIVTQRRQQDRGLKHKVHWPQTCCYSHMTKRKKVREKYWVQLQIASEDYLLLSHSSSGSELQDSLLAFGNLLRTLVLFIFRKINQIITHVAMLVGTIKSASLSLFR